MKSTSGVQDYIRRSGTPATFLLIGSFLAAFVLSWLMRSSVTNPLQFYTDWSQPWGLITYAWANTSDGQGLFWFLLEMYWLWWVGTSCERDLGTPKYLAFFFASIAAAALFLWAGISLVHGRVPLPILGGPGLAISAVTVAWGVRNPRACVKLFACIPVTGTVLAWLIVALDLFGYGSLYHAPIIGLFAIAHLGLAYLFATNRLPGVTYSRVNPSYQAAKAHERQDKSYFDEVRRREQDRVERERLRKLFEKSVDDEPGK
jgi:membrane associated rhomboid family serine protease